MYRLPEIFLFYPSPKGNQDDFLLE